MQLYRYATPSVFPLRVGNCAPIQLFSVRIFLALCTSEEGGVNRRMCIGFLAAYMTHDFSVSRCCGAERLFGMDDAVRKDNERSFHDTCAFNFSLLVWQLVVGFWDPQAVDRLFRMEESLMKEKERVHVDKQRHLGFMNQVRQVLKRWCCSWRSDRSGCEDDVQVLMAQVLKSYIF